MNMPHKNAGRLVGAMLLLAAASAAQAQLPWSEETHQIAFGDFNGDGKTDLLYIARNSGENSGIALSNSAGPYNLTQTWASNHLGIAWHSATYKPIVEDFSGDGKADIFLQRQAQGDHYLLHANAQGQFTAIGQTLPFNHGGQIWSADGHRIVAGDFNGDAKSDLFLQSVDPNGLNAVFLAGGSGIFGSAQQTWGNTHIGFRWSLRNAVVSAGDFNGDGNADLFVQAKPDILIIDYDVPFPVLAYRTGSFGVANAKAPNSNGEIFFTPALQIWNRNYLGADWSAANYDAVVGDFSGDGQADIILQGKKAGMTNAQFNASSSGQFTTTNALTDPTLISATGDQYRFSAANFDGTAGVGLYIQALTTGGISSIAWNSTSTSGSWERYEYDELGRLRTETFANGLISTYTLDAAGNRQAFTTGTNPPPPTHIAITNWNGTILPAAASLYTVEASCSSGQWHTACTWVVRKLYGNQGAVVVVAHAPNGANPACSSGTTQQITTGYVLTGCALSSTVYGQ
jgi:YD repeat-containing protein